MGISCVTDTTTWDNTIGGALEAKIPLWLKDSSAGASLKYDQSFGGSKAVQICKQTGVHASGSHPLQRDSFLTLQ